MSVLLFGALYSFLLLCMCVQVSVCFRRLSRACVWSLRMRSRRTTICRASPAYCRLGTFRLPFSSASRCGNGLRGGREIIYSRVSDENRARAVRSSVPVQVNQKRARMLHKIRSDRKKQRKQERKRGKVAVTEWQIEEEDRADLIKWQSGFTTILKVTNRGYVVSEH